MAGYGEPLKIHELHIDKLMESFEAKGVTTTTSKIKRLHPAQSLILKDPARFKVMACGRRFGKSLFCTAVATAVALQPGRKIWVVSDNYGLTDRVFSELFHIFVNELKLATAAQGGGASKLNRYIRLPNGSTIEGKSCENRKSLVGESIDFLIWDECGLTMNGHEIWNQELRPTLIDREGSAIFISTPRGKNHFWEFYKLGETGLRNRKKLENGEELNELDRATTDWSGFRFSSYCNTVEEGGFLKKTEIDQAKLTTPDVKFRQEYMADFTAVADSAFPEFYQETQVVDWDYRPDLPVFCGVDFNYQTPCTTLYLQIDPSLNILVFDEFHPEAAHVTAHSQAKQLRDKDADLGGAVQVVAADISGKQMSLQGRSAWADFKDWGIDLVGKKQPIETGCDLIRLWCKFPKTNQQGFIQFEEDGETVETEPKLFIHERCKNLIFALEAARAEETRNGIPKEGYKKDGITDGPLDALRYIMVYLLHDSGLVGQIPVR